MNDLISRQAAIDAVWSVSKAVTTLAIRARHALRELPPAEPERKKGRWIYGEHDTAMCDGYKCKGETVKTMKIKVRYTRDILPIEKIEQGNWIDLRCAEDTTMFPGDYMQIPLGVAMELPEGYEALVAPRSSTFKKYGVLLANSLGIIDESYRGDNDEWCFPAYATRQVTIPKNERICQFRIIYRQPDCEIETVETLGNKDRGGIGSTGRV